MNTKTIATKFVKWDIPNLESLKSSKEYILREKLNMGERLSRDEKNWITQAINHNSFFKSAIPLYGYRFDFSDILKTYLIKQYGHYREYKAIDKTSLRAIVRGKIERIIEI